MHPLAQVVAIWIAYLLTLGGISLLWLAREMRQERERRLKEHIGSTELRLRGRPYTWPPEMRGPHAFVDAKYMLYEHEGYEPMLLN